MRRGEDFLGRDVGVAGDTVLGRGRAALPFMAVSEANGEVDAGAGIFQRVEALAVQPFCALGQHCIVLVPGCDCAVLVDARGGKDRVRKLRNRDVLGIVGEDLLRPGSTGIGDDVPVGLESDDLLQRRLVGDRIGLAGARDLGRILARQQHRVVADHGKPGGIVGKSFGHALVEPAGGAVETGIVPKTIARQRQLFVGEECRDEASARLVGMLGNTSHQRQRRHRRGQQQVLPRLQLQADLDRDFGEPVEFDRIDTGGNVAWVRGHGGLKMVAGQR